MRLPIRPASRHAVLFLVSALSLSCGGDGSGGTGPTPNPAPTITAGSRDTITATSGAFSEILTGTDFMNGVVGLLDGNARITNRLSSGSIAVQLTAADLAVPGDRQITAKNPEPGGGPSAPWVLHVLTPPPAPTIDSIAPDTVQAGRSSFQLDVYGGSFNGQSVIRWNDSTLATVRPSGTHLYATVPASLVASAGSRSVKVFTPAPGGGVSAAKSMVVVPAPAVPTITGATPDTIVIGPDTVSLELHGHGFIGVDSVGVNNWGYSRNAATSAASDTVMTILLDKSWLTSLDVVRIRLHSHAGWGPWSSGLTTVDPIPVITGVSPDTLMSTQAADTFYVIGTGFVAGMNVQVNGAAIASSVRLGYDSIRAIVTGETLLLGGTPAVTVYDAYEGRSSAPQSIAILSPAPTVDSISPSSTLAGVAGSYTLYGKNFRGLGKVLVNGIAQTTTYFTTDAINFLLDSMTIQAAGTYQVAFRTPAPGGGTSDSVALQVIQPNPIPVVDSIVPAVLRSDSGVQIVSIHGHKFMPGTVIELRTGPQDWDPVDTLPMLSGDSTSATAEIPPALLQAGRELFLALRAPAPTVASSTPKLLPVWTTGVRAVSVLPGIGTYSWAGDTVRHLMYGVTVDGNTANEVTTLVARDPTSGGVVKTLPLPDFGARLFYDGSSKYLYAVCAYGLKVCRIDLDAWTLDWAIDAFTVNGNLTGPVFIAPQAAHPGTFAVGVNQTGNEYANWVRVYDGTVPRAQLDTFYSGVHTGKFFGDTLVMLNIYNAYRRSVTPIAESALDSVPFALTLGAPGRILSPTRAVAGGHLVDLTSGTDLAAHDGLLTNYISTGPVAGRFYTAWSTDPVPTLHLSLFDLDTGTELRQVGLDGAYPDAFGISPAGLPFLGYSGIGIRIVESVISDP